MSLTAVLDSIDSLPDAIKAEYKAGTGELEGKFVLDVVAAHKMSLGDNEGAYNALQSERGISKDLKSKLSLYTIDGTDVTAQQAIDAITKLKNFDPADKEKIKKAIEDEVKSGYENKQSELNTKYETDTKTLNDTNSKLRSQLHKELITSKATIALSDKAPDAVALLLPHVEAQARVEDNDDGTLRVVIKNAEGGTRLSPVSQNNNPMTLDELVDEMSKKDEFSKVFAGSNSQGGGGSGGAGGKNKTKSSGDAHGAALLSQVRKAEVS